jgi:hypothetical protein
MSREKHCPPSRKPDYFDDILQSIQIWRIGYDMRRGTMITRAHGAYLGNLVRLANERTL